MKTKVGELYFIKQRYFQKYSDTFPDATSPYPGVYANKNRSDVAFTQVDGDTNLSYRPFLKVFVVNGNKEIGMYVPLSTADMEYRKNRISMDFYRKGNCRTYDLVEDNLHYQSIALNRNVIPVRDDDIYSEANFQGVKKELSESMVRSVRENVMELIKAANRGKSNAFDTNLFGMINEMVRDINLEKQQAKLASAKPKLSEEINVGVSEKKYTVTRAVSGEQVTDKDVTTKNDQRNEGR